MLTVLIVMGCSMAFGHDPATKAPCTCRDSRLVPLAHLILHRRRHTAARAPIR